MAGYITEPDWYKAPDDAEFFGPETDTYHASWYKNVDQKTGSCEFINYQSKEKRWRQTDISPSRVSELMPIPVKFKGENPWLNF